MLRKIIKSIYALTVPRLVVLKKFCFLFNFERNIYSSQTHVVVARINYSFCVRWVIYFKHTKL